MIKIIFDVAYPEDYCPLSLFVLSGDVYQEVYIHFFGFTVDSNQLEVGMIELLQVSLENVLLDICIKREEDFCCGMN